MINKSLTVTNKLGLHARASAKIVEVSNRYEADLWLEAEGEKVNGKSIMGIMMLAAAEGTEINVYADGKDEESMMKDMEELFLSKFGED